MTSRTGAEAVRAIEADVGHCCGDVLNLTGEDLEGILDQHAAEAVRAEREALVADFRARAQPQSCGCAQCRAYAQAAECILARARGAGR